MDETDKPDEPEAQILPFKARMLCHEVQRIETPDALPERYVDGDWQLLAYVK